MAPIRRQSTRLSSRTPVAEDTVPESTIGLLSSPRATSRHRRNAVQPPNAASPLAAAPARVPTASSRRRVAPPMPRASTPIAYALQHPPVARLSTSRGFMEGTQDLNLSFSFLSNSDDAGHNASRPVPPASMSQISSSAALITGSNLRSSATRARKILTKPCSMTPRIPLRDSELDRLQDVSQTAFWTLSSAKIACGVENLLDDRLDTFWQSDGFTPHLINVQFLQSKLDESYTPQKVSIRTGNYLLDLEELTQYELRDPKGWEIIHIPNEPWGAPHRCFMLQIAILTNHQQGRDSHLRQIKILSEKNTQQQSTVSVQKPASMNPNTGMMMLGPQPTTLPLNRWQLR